MAAKQGNDPQFEDLIGIGPKQMDDEEHIVPEVDEAIRKWLDDFSLTKYANALSAEGLDSIGDVLDLEEDDIDGLIADAGLSKSDGKTLRKAIAAVKSAEHGKHGADLEEEVDAETMALRKKRSDYRGNVEIPKTKSRRKERAWHIDVDPDTAHDGKTERVVMFIGLTGAGKTETIQSMTNHLFKVAHDEQFRYQLICEQNDEKIDRDPTKSQTVDINSYHIHNIPGNDEYSLTIVDTPGFGGASDLEIQRKFRHFFESVSFVHAIYFVVKGTTTRIDAAQKHQFKMVLNLFGHDVTDNLFIVFTFADAGDPPALDAVNALKIHHAKWFKLNNAGFALPKKKKDRVMSKPFYSMGSDTFDEMLQCLLKTERVTINIPKEQPSRPEIVISENKNYWKWIIGVVCLVGGVATIVAVAISANK